MAGAWKQHHLITWMYYRVPHIIGSDAFSIDAGIEPFYVPVNTSHDRAQTLIVKGSNFASLTLSGAERIEDFYNANATQRKLIAHVDIARIGNRDNRYILKS